jgi:hypothetical protein
LIFEKAPYIWSFEKSKVVFCKNDSNSHLSRGKELAKPHSSTNPRFRLKPDILNRMSVGDNLERSKRSESAIGESFVPDWSEPESLAPYESDDNWHHPTKSATVGWETAVADIADNSRCYQSCLHHRL